MSRRFRTLAGLLALVAMTASFSQAALASVCASPAGMAAMTDMAMSMVGAENGDSSGEHQMPCDWMGHTDGSGESGQHCPLTPTATQGCTATASAPAKALAVDLSTAQSARHRVLDLVEPELLLADAPYHPPRA